MIRWRFLEPSPMRDVMDQWLQEMPRRWRGELGRGEPMPMNVHDTEAETVIEAALPGVKPDDVEITANAGVLTIRGHSHVEEKDYHHQELYSATYQRQLSVPPDLRLDQARAEFQHGILTIHLPKQQPRAPQRIRVEIAGGSGAPTSIEATKGTDYSEVQSTPKPTAPRKAAPRKSSASGSAQRASRRPRSSS